VFIIIADERVRQLVAVDVFPTLRSLGHLDNSLFVDRLTKHWYDSVTIDILEEYSGKSIGSNIILLERPVRTFNVPRLGFRRNNGDRNKRLGWLISLVDRWEIYLPNVGVSTVRTWRLSCSLRNDSFFAADRIDDRYLAVDRG